MTTLSILIPTLENRKRYLDRLLNCLEKQIDTNEVEYCFETDNGERSIGEKRNLLLQEAKGKYIAFVDDDDLVSSDYIEKVLDAIHDPIEPDCIGMHLLHYEDNALRGFTYHSLRYKSWYDKLDTTTGMKRYYRNPNHLNPVKRELALATKFPNISMGEDRDYSTRLLPLLKTEVYIYEPIYYYLYRSIK